MSSHSKAWLLVLVLFRAKALGGQNSTLVQEALKIMKILQPGLSKLLRTHRPPPALASHQTAAHGLLDSPCGLQRVFLFTWSRARLAEKSPGSCVTPNAAAVALRAQSWAPLPLGWVPAVRGAAVEWDVSWGWKLAFGQHLARGCSSPESAARLAVQGSW